MAIRKKIKRYFSTLTRKKREKITIPPDIVTKANKGDAMAQLELGKIYYNSISVENNYNIAFDWIHRSAKQDNMEAQFRLGDLYGLGFGAKKCLSESYKWYTKAAIQGYKKAMIRIHNLYQEDIKMHCRGVINDKEKEHSSDDFKKENNIRELNEYRLEQNRNILNGAIEYYTNQFKFYQSSDQNDPVVQLNLAFLYQHGYGTKKCIRWAFEYYTLAAEQGDTDAQYNLGRLYQQHIRKKFNYRDAFKWYSESAHGGNMTAQRCLAYFYLKGLATEINYDMAISWYTKAAESGDSQAQVTIGMLYRKGDHVKQNLLTAVKWYTLAARQGSIVAQNCLSQLHQRGMLVDIELDDVSKYFTDGLVSNRLRSKLSMEVSKLEDSPEYKQLNKLAKYAIIGDGPAMFEIGLRYYNGSDEFPQDKDIGIKWIKNAANREHKEAQFMMADLYKEGDSVEQNYQKSYIWYKKITKQKDPNAQCKIGVAYHKGFGVRKDSLEASKWFTWAADQGNSDAQFYFGMLRFHGDGIRESKKESEEWLYKSALQRNTQACHKLGKLYYDGQFNTKVKNYTKTGLKLLEFAAKHSNVDAQMDLALIYKNGKNTPQNLTKSIEYYTMAAGSGSGESQYKLAIMYLDGNGIDPNYTKAYDLFKRASNSGHKNASNLFQIPIVYDSNIKEYSKVIYMFAEVTEKGVDDLCYNIGLLLKRKNHNFPKISGNYYEPEYWFLRASKNGDSRADFQLGIIYEFFKVGSGNFYEATKYYENAAKKQNSDAMFNLACIYLNNDSILQDSLEAFHLFTKASFMGCTNATKAISVLEHDNNLTYYPNSFNKYLKVTIDKEKLISMLEKATKEGYTQLQYQLGVMYERNNNLSKAFKWLSFAAEIGVTDAYYRLGVMYEEGRGVEQNYLKAANMYQEATKSNHEDACYRLGQFYQYGSGVELDYSKAYNFYKKAAEMGHKMAAKVLNITQEIKMLANMDIEENFFDYKSKEYQDSIVMCKYVAEQGDTEMQFRIGFAYEYNYIELGYEEVYKWYSMAAKSLHREAMYHLGLLYEKGLGVPQDYYNAIQLYNQALQLGSDDALHRLGTIYHYGKGVEIDPVKAIEYYTLAAIIGNPEYQCALGLLYENGELVQKSLIIALKWYTKAYLQGYDEISLKLYTMYEDKPYDSFFFEKLFRNLLVASHNHFSLNNEYKYEVYVDINNRLGFMHYFGVGTVKNLKQSLQYFLKEYSDKAKVSITEFLVSEYGGLSFSQKIGIMKEIANNEECMDLFKPEDIYLLGVLFYNGRVLSQYFNCGESLYNSGSRLVFKKDYLTAFNYFKRAADKNLSEAMFLLGIMYYCGYGVPKNNDQADSYFERIPRDNTELIKKIIILYHTHNDIQDFSKAFDYYKRFKKESTKAVNISDHQRKLIYLFSQTGLGFLHEYGDGVKQDYQKALYYYKKLADNKHRIGYLRLGLMYYYGKGVPVDYKKAFDYFRGIYGGFISEDQIPYVYDWNTFPRSDDGDSQIKLVYCIKTGNELYGEIYYYLGLLYKYGHGVIKDENDAQKYFSWAFSRGCKRAKYEIKA